MEGGLTDQDWVKYDLDQTWNRFTNRHPRRDGGSGVESLRTTAWTQSFNNGCPYVVISIDHPEIAGHWVVVMPSPNENARIFDSFTGCVIDLPWGTLTDWFRR